MLRRRLREVPFGLHHPVWIDDSRFDVEYRAPFEGVANRAVMRNWAKSWRHPEPTARSASSVVGTAPRGGLADDRFALVTKVHHAAVDGVSGIELMTILLSPEPSQT